jgi:hypothetical protein
VLSGLSWALLISSVPHLDVLVHVICHAVVLRLVAVVMCGTALHLRLARVRVSTDARVSVTSCCLSVTLAKVVIKTEESRNRGSAQFFNFLLNSFQYAIQAILWSKIGGLRGWSIFESFFTVSSTGVDMCCLKGFGAGAGGKFWGEPARDPWISPTGRLL